MSKFITTVESADGSISWAEHGGFTPSGVSKEKIDKIGADDAISKEIESEITSDEFTPTELDLILTPLSKHFSDLKNKTERVVSNILKYAETLQFGINVKYDDEVVKSSGSQSSKELETVIESVEQDWLRKLDSTKREFTHDLNKAAKDEQLKARNLRHFRKNNNLKHRDASYPDSRIMHIALILIALVGEAIGNAYFYSQGSELGLLGGWLSALLVSAANVAVSFIIGFVFLRYLTHKKLIPKIWGFIGLILGLGALSLLHLGAAHYRELLMVNPDDAHLKVLSSVINNPFNLNDLDTLVMILLGVSITFLIMRKGYTYDDSYPGYGKVWREWESKYDSWSSIDSSFRKDSAKLMDDAKRQVHQIENAVEKTNSEFVKLKQDFGPYIESVNTNVHDSLSSAVNYCSLYRDSFNEITGKEVLDNEVGKLTLTIEERFQPHDFKEMLSDKEKKLNDYANTFKKWSSSKLKELKKAHQDLSEEFANLTSEDNEVILRKEALNKAQKTIEGISGDIETSPSS